MAVNTITLLASLIDDSNQDGALQTVIKKTLNKDVKCLKVKVKKITYSGIEVSFLRVNDSDNMPFTTPMTLFISLLSTGISCTLKEDKQAELNF